MLLWSCIWICCLGYATSKVLQLSSCQAIVDERMINLQPLRRQDGAPRFSANWKEWNFTFNPCESYNMPHDPHSGYGDQCLYVAMCGCKAQENSDKIEYFTMGIQRTVRIHLRRPYFLDDLSSLQSSEEDSREPWELPSNRTAAADDDDTQGGDAREDLSDKPDDFYAVPRTTKSTGLTSSTTQDFQTVAPTEIQGNDEKVNMTTRSTEEVTPETVNRSRRLRQINTSRRRASRERGVSKREARKGDAIDYEDYAEMENSPRIVLSLRGIRSMKRQKSYIYLVCNPVLRQVNEAQFVYVGRNEKNFYFELHHKCCCPGGCINGNMDTLPANETIADAGLKKALASQHMWIVIVVNAGVLLTAVMIGMVCCRSGGNAGPYNMLPALHSSRMFHSSESMSSYKAPHRPPEHLEYSSSLLMPSKLPVLDNCVIPARDLDIGQRLGGGLFGDTYIAEWRDRQVAVKRFTVGVHQSQVNEEDQEWLAREVYFLSRQRNKHVVTLLGICLELRTPHIVNEFIEGQSFKEFLVRELHSLSLARRVKMLIQVTEGMHFLHSAKTPVLHRDLRCSNLLITTNDKIKICDFGITKLIQRLRQECTGREGCYCQKHYSALPASIRWTAPEILQSPNAEEADTDAFTPACDIYSFAMVLWEVASGLDPYEDIQDEKDVLTVVLRGGRPNPDAIQGCIPHYRELMKVCWDSEPEARPNFKQLTMHLKTVLNVARKFEASNRTRTDSGSTYLKSALSIHIDKL